MKKKGFIILGAVLLVLLVLALVFVFFINGEKTLEEITSAKSGGGSLRYELNDYTIVEVWFSSTSKKGDEREGICYIQTNYYKKASYSASGKVFDYCDTQEIPCTFTDYSLTLNGIDHYTYEVKTLNGKEYVVFSKPFYGVTSWPINK